MKNPLDELQAFVDNITASKHSLRVLEAGCGSLSNLTLGPNAHIVGLDISPEHLVRNRTIHEAIVADLEAHELLPSEYDIIICWDLLEHLLRPLDVIRKFVTAIKDDGIIILAFPNVLSLKGLIAKYTPFCLHKAVSRFVYGDRVGRPGYEVCPTVLRYSIAPSSIVRYAGRHGCDVLFLRTFESGMQQKFREKCGLLSTRWLLIRTLVRLLTFGLLDAEATDCIVVFRPSEQVPRLHASSTERA